MSGGRRYGMGGGATGSNPGVFFEILAIVVAVKFIGRRGHTLSEPPLGFFSGDSSNSQLLTPTVLGDRYALLSRR